MNNNIQRIEMDSQPVTREEQNVIIIYDVSSGKYNLDPASIIDPGQEHQLLGQEKTAVDDAARDSAGGRYSSPNEIDLRITDQLGLVSSYKLERGPDPNNYYGGPWRFTLGKLTISEATDVCDIIQQVMDDIV